MVKPTQGVICMADLSAKKLGLTKSSLPNSIIEVISTLNKAGFEAYIVGGCVRDSLTGLHPKDFDAVTDAKPNEIKAVFGKRCRIIGRRFQLAHVYSGREMIEVATFRAPPKGDAHTTDEGMLMRDNVWGDIKQDSARRDFSINALYYQPLKGVVKDFCHAIDDIESRTIRLLGHAETRIEEDPVRLLRALRFKAKLGFEFDADLAEQFNGKNWALLDQVSPHRLYDESQKMFTGGYIVPLLPILYEYRAMEHLFIYPDNEPSRLVQQVAINTDKRIASGKSINPAFFYAAMLWKNYLYQLDKYKKRNMPFAEAQQKAASKVIERQRLKTAIPKFAEQFIKDIWLLQPRLANPRAKQIEQLAEHPKFRAGFDFLLLREQCNEQADTPLAEPTNGMGQWWHDFQTLSENDKQRAIAEFAGEVRQGKGSRESREGRSSRRSRRERLRHSNEEGNFANSANFSNQQTEQDSQEKAQLQMLSLTAQENTQAQTNSKRPSPLFTVEGSEFIELAGESQSAKKTSNKSSKKSTKQSTKAKKSKTANLDEQKLDEQVLNNVNDASASTFAVKEATKLQSMLLDTAYVPAERRRRQT